MMQVSDHFLQLVVFVFGSLLLGADGRDTLRGATDDEANTQNSSPPTSTTTSNQLLLLPIKPFYAEYKGNNERHHGHPIQIKTKLNLLDNKLGTLIQDDNHVFSGKHTHPKRVKSHISENNEKHTIQPRTNHTEIRTHSDYNSADSGSHKPHSHSNVSHSDFVLPRLEAKIAQSNSDVPLVGTDTQNPENETTHPEWNNSDFQIHMPHSDDGEAPVGNHSSSHVTSEDPEDTHHNSNFSHDSNASSHSTPNEADVPGSHSEDFWGNVDFVQNHGFMIPVVRPVHSFENGIHETDAETQLTMPTDVSSTASRRVKRDASKGLLSNSDELPIMCGEYHLVPGSSLSLASPYHPANYPEHFSCRWSISAVAGEKIAINCDSFELATGDYLAVGTEGDPSSLVRYTQSRVLRSTVLPSNKVFVSFFSDGQQQSEGFSCVISSMGVEDSTSEDEGTGSTEAQASSATGSWKQKCGISNSATQLLRIVNGVQAEEHEYPWMVFLRVSWVSGGTGGCGGTIISPRHVLTAAHCVMKRNSTEVPRVSVYVGIHEFRNSAPVGGKAFSSARVLVHPMRSFSHDIAIIEVDEDIPLDGKVAAAACLPSSSTPSFNNRSLIVSGWGLDETGVQPASLRKLIQTGLNWEKCQTFYGAYITSHHFCTTSNKGGHICLGDSGGAVMSEAEGLDGSYRHWVVGIISFVASPNCNLNFPDGHISVANFIPWIQKMTGITL